MNVRFFNPGLSYLKIRDEILPEIDRILTAGKLILQEDLTNFEKNLAAYVGTKYAIGVNSGTDALYLALKAIDVGPGDEVITCSHTFVATVQVIGLAGAKPILVDIDDAALMDLSRVKEKITSKTKAIIPVNLTGDMVDMLALQRIIDETGQKIYIIEDAAQAIGATHSGIRSGSYGFGGCFSFYPAKILGCYGDGGALTTNDENMAREVDLIRNHYKPGYERWGVNSRLDNIQAAVLNIRLKYLPGMLAERKRVSERYNEELGGTVYLPENREGRVWQDYVVGTPRRNELYDFLKKEGVETMKNEYPFPIEKGWKSLRYEAETLRIPCNENLTDDEITYVVEKIHEFFKK